MEESGRETILHAGTYTVCIRVAAPQYGVKSLYVDTPYTCHMCKIVSISHMEVLNPDEECRQYNKQRGYKTSTHSLIEIQGFRQCIGSPAA